MFKNGIIPEILPERVFSILKYLETQSDYLNNMREKFQSKLLNLSNSTGYSYFSISFNACIELNLVKLNEDDRCEYIGSKEVIKNIDNFRRYCNSVIWNDVDSEFFKIANAMLLINDDVYTYSSITSSQFSQRLVEYKINAPTKNILGERFWLTFLGLGRIYERSNNITFLPNSADYLRDMIKICNFKVNDKIDFNSFVQKVYEISKLTFFENNSINKVNIAMSFALRTLNDLNVIKLENNLDSANTYRLYESAIHGFGNSFTHLIIKKVV